MRGKRWEDWTGRHEEEEEEQHVGGLGRRIVRRSRAREAEGGIGGGRR